ncbi:MAG: 2-amino-4-hydroxy-6-hydroxymethyldihydropteridine diphosphokinase [Flavobacteriales bacterium]|nr:2-amino-4-hydroxy-6-hydroxymethyldihydropteridine diphosphokinase [Flavobacteriales bacterium]
MTLKEAGTEIEDRIGKVTSTSSIYRSEPWGFQSTHHFLNQALIISSELSPIEVLMVIHQIEEGLGRIRESLAGYMSRTIDIDILHWNGGTITEATLKVPHPLIAQRRFALLPLCEIAGGAIHPTTGLTYQELLNACSDTGDVHQLPAP